MHVVLSRGAADKSHAFEDTDGPERVRKRGCRRSEFVGRNVLAGSAVNNCRTVTGMGSDPVECYFG